METQRWSTSSFRMAQVSMPRLRYWKAAVVFYESWTNRTHLCCAFRTDTLPCIRQRSKETHTSLMCCCSTVPNPTLPLWYASTRTLTRTRTHAHTRIMVCFPVQNGNTALGIARRLGYISVVDTLRVVTEEIITTTTVRHTHLHTS